jgi:hypothetical protein
MPEVFWSIRLDISGGDASGPDRRGGVSGGYGDDDRDRTFLWGKGGLILVHLARQ